MIKRVAVLLGCTVLVVAAAASAGNSTKFFLSANGNISCQVSYGGALGRIAYCQTLKPAQSVQLHLNGFAKICKGVRCLGNPPENATKLKAGKSVSVGRFFCKAESSSKIVCSVARLGLGFEASSKGIEKVTLRES